ncbi:hypothetical protein [Plantactinospora sp. KLBMP9567]|uniref:hypothetical protein n=1 Tax=Plantactinospora sp. KLBMP9567 TaxID=3085900 RepID=UPI0029816C97|nr:hypothetical protein [Plantactinospora sp. KLBMP9567]MDW5326045.1 hypothetical protein [Plantactinospora sp. KLBMP9567]
MIISEETPGVWIAVVPAPVTPVDLAALAEKLPAGVALATIEIDHDGKLYSSWEAPRVAPLD